MDKNTLLKTLILPNLERMSKMCAEHGVAFVASVIEEDETRTTFFTDECSDHRSTKGAIIFLTRDADIETLGEENHDEG